MTEISKCPKCGSEYVYFDGSLYVCPDCAYEFNEEDATATETVEVAKDSNGAELFDGDAVTVIKDLKVKGSSMVIKRGTKVKSIRLTENPEEVDSLMWIPLTELEDWLKREREAFSAWFPNAFAFAMKVIRG